MKKYIKSGQSLFEVLFAVAIAALILIAVVSLSTQSVKNSDASKNNAIASKYAQQGLEWVRKERDTLGWSVFVTHYPGSNDTAMSLGQLSWTATPDITGTIFSRTLTLNQETADTYEAIIRVTWEDSGGEHEVVNSTKLTNWRN